MAFISDVGTLWREGGKKEEAEEIMGENKRPPGIFSPQFLLISQEEG